MRSKDDKSVMGPIPTRIPPGGCERERGTVITDAQEIMTTSTLD